MRAFAIVLGRELAERRLLIVASSLMGLVPLGVGVAFLPLGSHRGAEARAGSAIALALIVSGVLALVLGSTVLARDLSERRMGFYLSRPLAAWALWAGKLAGAALLAFGCGVLVLVPSLLLGDDPEASWRELAFWAGSVLAMVLLANAVSVTVRSRSPWLLLDLLAPAGLAGLVWILTQRLLRNVEFEIVSRAHIGLLAVAFLSLLLASAAQVIWARTDLRQAHRVHSLTLWGLLGLSILLFAGSTHWLLSAGPGGLVQLQVETVQPAPMGSWIAVGGGVRSRRMAQWFLLDAASGRFFRIPLIPYGPGDLVTFSQDGRRAVWLEAEGGRRILPLAVHRLDLDRPGASPIAEQIECRQSDRVLTLSPDGERVAVICLRRIQVHELGTGRLLMSQGELSNWGLLRFLDRRTLRFVGSRETDGRETPDGAIDVEDFDVETGRILREMRVSREGQAIEALSADGQRLLLRSRMVENGNQFLQVADLRTGEISQPIPLPQFYRAHFLRDGRLAAVWFREDRVHLRILDEQGKELWRVELPGWLHHLGGQPAPGLLAVATTEKPLRDPEPWRTFLLDLDRGTRRLLGERLVPVGRPGLPVGSLGTKLFLEGEDRLVQIDPRTGGRRVILPPAR